MSSLVCKEIKPVNYKGNQPWIFIGRTDAEAEAPMLWPPDTKNRLIWKDPDAEKDWRQKEKGMTEDEVVGWWTWVWASSKSWWWTGKPGVLQSMGVTKSRTGLSNWTDTFTTLLVLSFILNSGNMSPLTLLFFFFQNCFGYSSSLIFSIHTLDSICLYIERVLLRLNL